MIYTLTCNPSLDYRITVTDFQLGKTNRTSSQTMVAGGKGINVSRMLKNLGLESVCFGFVAGFTGEEITRQVTHMGLKQDFVVAPSGMSRINVKLATGSFGESGRMEETEVNGIGPKITQECVEQLMKKLDKIRQGDILLLSGSIPKGVPDTFYQGIFQQLSHRNVEILVDAGGELLLHTLSERPFLVKPNQQELEELFHTKIGNKEDVIQQAKRIQVAGAKNVIVSLGEEGAILIAENGSLYRAKAPRGKLVNGVGAGDSMIAGFLAGYLEKADYEYAFRMGVAAGSASAFSQGFADRQAVEELKGKVEMMKLGTLSSFIKA